MLQLEWGGSEIGTWPKISALSGRSPATLEVTKGNLSSLSESENPNCFFLNIHVMPMLHPSSRPPEYQGDPKHLEIPLSSNLTCQ